MSTPTNPGKLEFDVVLFAESGGTGINVPFSVVEVFGTRGQVKVRGTIDGWPYRTSIAPMGGGTHAMVVKREIREAIGKGAGDTVHVVMELDTEERIVVVPEDFQQALDANAQAREILDRFAYTHRKEYVQWVESAKRPETRQRRIAQAVERIAAGIKFS